MAERKQQEDRIAPLEELLRLHRIQFDPSEHLTPEQFFDLAERRWRARNYKTLIKHLTICDDCRQTYLELKSLQSLVRSMSKPQFALFRLSVLVPAGAAAVALVLFALWWGFLRPSPSHVAGLPADLPGASPAPRIEQPAPVPPKAEPSTPPAPSSSRAPQRSIPVQQSVPAREPSPPPAQRIQIAKNLLVVGDRVYEGDYALPVWAREIALRYGQNPPVVRADAMPSPPLVQLIRPPLLSSRSIEDTQPVFEWHSAGQAVEYHVRLYRLFGDDTPVEEEDMAEVRDALEVRGSRAIVRRELEPGQQYLLRIEWSVSAADSQALEKGRADYRFYVLTAQERERISWVRNHKQIAPLTCAMILLELGYYEDALRLLQSRADDPRVKVWLEYCRQRLELRRKNPMSW